MPTLFVTIHLPMYYLCDMLYILYSYREKLVTVTINFG